MSKTPSQDPAPKRRDPEDTVDEQLDDELEDSFPASDPPASTAPGHREPDEEDNRPTKAALPDAAS